MTQTEIFQEFKTYNLKIISETYLKEYIKFCFDKNLHSPVKGKTSHHHILPQANTLPFTKFKSLKKYSWNGTHLMYSDHYIAHSLLAKAIDSIPICSAWYGLNNKDFKLGRILSPIELIGSKLHQTLMEKRSINQGTINKSQKHIISRRKTMSIVGKDGLNMYQRQAIKTKNSLIKSGKCKGVNNSQFNKVPVKLRTKNSKSDIIMVNKNYDKSVYVHNRLKKYNLISNNQIIFSGWYDEIKEYVLNNNLSMSQFNQANKNNNFIMYNNAYLKNQMIKRNLSLYIGSKLEET